jgi:hypothetical protein
MARQNRSKKIGQYTYEVTQLGAVEGSRVLAHIMQLFGGMVGAIASGGKPDMVHGFSALANSITPEKLEFFCNTFSPWTQVHKDGKAQILKDVFDDHFAANYSELVEWLGFCLEVNYESFLGGKSVIAAFMRGPATASSGSGSPKE